LGYRDFWPTFIQTVYALGLGTAVAVVAIIADQEGREMSLLWYTGAAIVLLTCLRLARCIWLLTLLIDAFAPPLGSDE
jgi:hypothetical protein